MVLDRQDLLGRIWKWVESEQDEPHTEMSSSDKNFIELV